MQSDWQSQLLSGLVVRLRTVFTGAERAALEGVVTQKEAALLGDDVCFALALVS